MNIFLYFSSWTFYTRLTCWKVYLVIRSRQWLTAPLGVAGANHIVRWLRFLFHRWNLNYCGYDFYLLITDRLLTLIITCYQFYTTNGTIPHPVILCYITMHYMFAFTLYSSVPVSHYNKTQESQHAQHLTSSIWSMLVIFILSLTTRVIWPNYIVQ